MCFVGAGSPVKTPWLCLHIRDFWEAGESRSSATKAGGAGLWCDAAENKGWTIGAVRATSWSAWRFLWHRDFSKGVNLQLWMKSLEIPLARRQSVFTPLFCLGKHWENWGISNSVCLYAARTMPCGTILVTLTSCSISWWSFPNNILHCVLPVSDRGTERMLHVVFQHCSSVRTGVSGEQLSWIQPWLLRN